MLRLSYTTISSSLQSNNSHCWINRISNVPVPESKYSEDMENGKRLHRLIQDNLSNPDIEHRPYKMSNYFFPVVEKVDKDINTYFTKTIDKDFEVHGYVDGYDFNTSELLEIKTGTNMWSLNDFLKSPQMGIYTFCLPHYKKLICVTALSDEKTWERQPPKIYQIPITDKMRDRGQKYIQDAINLFKEGAFKGGLNEQGKCEKYCYFGNNCLFR